MKVVITLVVIALLCLYLFFSVRSLIRSLKGLGRSASSFAEKASDRFNRYPPLPPDPQLLPPTDCARVHQAIDDLGRTSRERSAARHTRLDRSIERWGTVTSSSFPRMNVQHARNGWQDRKVEKAQMLSNGDVQ